MSGSRIFGIQDFLLVFAKTPVILRCRLSLPQPGHLVAGFVWYSLIV